MKILITNDDGIYAPGLWALVRKLQNLGEVLVAAPDREQSGISAAITLHHPLRVQKVKSEIAGIETYTVGGTPGDSVIMALCRLAAGRVDLVVSGVNNGPNTGDDVFLSGTVGAAMQGYFRGISSIAVSIDEVDSRYLDGAAGIAAALIQKIGVSRVPAYFLNINIPSLPTDEIKGVKITRLSTTGYQESVEEGHDGRRQYYWIKHQKIEKQNGKQTDTWAVNHGYVSITPLHSHIFKQKEPVLNGTITGLLPGIDQPL